MKRPNLIGWLVPLVLMVTAIKVRPWPWRLAASLAVCAFWIREYVRYRRAGLRRTRREYDWFRSISPDVYARHYNERVPTVEEELEEWGSYHRHRHEMRYDIVASTVRRHLPPSGRVLDVGCGAAGVADRITDVDAHYVGVDYGDPHIRYAARKHARSHERLRTSFARCDAAALPLNGSSVDVVVMSEVIEHLVRPELAIWEIARLLRPGGVLILTTNNASEVPLRSPLSQPLAWVEKAIGAQVPALISHRAWVWPEKVDPELLPAGSGDVYVPHTHHIPAETKRMLCAAGLSTVMWSTFEFPPPHSRSALVLERMGKAGRQAADVIEAIAHAIPFVRRLGTHLFLVARKTRDPVAATPPSGVWPGPFSGEDGELRRLDRARWPKPPRSR
ncbi:MAG: class I SAM-dependent methyltransferase [Actinomycetota bacterium]